MKIINNQTKYYKDIMFKLEKHSTINMHSHNLSAHLWYKSQQLKGKFLFKFPKKFKDK